MKKLSFNKVLVFVATLIFTIVVVLKFMTIQNLNISDENYHLYNIEGKELFSVDNENNKTLVKIYDQKRVKLRGLYEKYDENYIVYPYSFIDINSSNIDNKDINGSLVYQFISNSSSKSFKYPVRFRKFEIIGGDHYGKYLPIARLKSKDKPLLIIFPAKDKKIFGRTNSTIRAIALQKDLIYIDNKGFKKEIPYVKGSLSTILFKIENGSLNPVKIDKNGIITTLQRDTVLNLYLSSGLISKKKGEAYIQQPTKYFNIVEFSGLHKISKLILSSANKAFYIQDKNRTYLKAPKEIPIDKKIIVKGKDSLFNYSKYLSNADFSIDVPILDHPKVKTEKSRKSYLYDYLDLDNIFGLYVSDSDAKVYYSKDKKRWISAVENYKYAPPLYLFNPEIKGKFVAPLAFKNYKGKIYYKVVSRLSKYTLAFNGKINIDNNTTIETSYKQLIPITKSEVTIEAIKTSLEQCGKLFSLNENRELLYSLDNRKSLKSLKVEKSGLVYHYFIQEKLSPFKNYKVSVKGYKDFNYTPQLSCKYANRQKDKVVSLYANSNKLSIIPRMTHEKYNKSFTKIVDSNSTKNQKFAIEKELIPIYGDSKRFGLLSHGINLKDLTLDKTFSLDVAQIFTKTINPLLNNIKLQKKLNKYNEKIEGATVVIKINADGTREVVSMFSYPYPATDNLERELVLDRLNTKASTIKNRALTLLVHPGSTFKIVTSIALAKENKLQNLSLLKGKTDLYGIPLADGIIDFHLKNYTDPRRGTEVTRETDYINALRHSYNTYFGYSGLLLHSRLAKKYTKYLFPVLLNEQKRKQEYSLIGTAERLYFNQKIPLSLKYKVFSAASIFPTIFTSAKEVADSAIGQYEVYATPLQMALVATVIYDNRLILPTITKDDAAAQDVKKVKQLLPTKSIKQIQDAMNLVVKKGTARPAFKKFNFKKCEVYGKTGTAQKGKSNLYDGWFVSFTKGLKEDIAIATVVQNSGVGAKYSAVINRKIIEAWIKKLEK